MHREADETIKLLEIILGTTIITLLISAVFYTIGCYEYSSEETMELGKEFYFSIYNNRELKPYTGGGSPFSPFVNLCFYILFLCIPSSVSLQWGPADYFSVMGTTIDLRINQYTLIIYILLIILSIVLIISGCLLGIENQISTGILFAMACIVSQPMLYAYGRGSIYPYILALLLFFEMFDSSESVWCKRISLIILAMVISIDPIFFFFLVLYIKRKDYRGIAGVASGVMILNVIPLLVYGWKEIGEYFRCLALNYIYAAGEGLNLFDFANAIQNELGISIRVRYMCAIVGLFIITLIISAIWESEKWRMCLHLVLLIILCSPVSTNSVLIGLFYVFFILLRHREKSLEMKDYLELGFSCFCLIVPTVLRWEIFDVDIQNIVMQITIILLAIMIIFGNLIKKLNNIRRQGNL